MDAKRIPGASELDKNAHRAYAHAADKYAADLIESLQAQLTQQQSDEPLTLDELREMDDEPIYIKHLMGEWHWDGWHILENCEEELIMHDGSILIDENYGKTWLAYRRKPEGEAQ